MSESFDFKGPRGSVPDANGHARAVLPGAVAVPERFPDSAREALYRVMELRRDVREFRPGPVDPEVLTRILRAATLAPSVGFSQPWGFVVVRDQATRARIRASFLRCREAEAARFPESRRQKYLAYKLEGIVDSALNLCVVADLRSRGEAILGTTVQPEAVRASVACAVQNLWLAARAEGIGVGWVSIVEPAVLRSALELPRGVEPVAYLCLGLAAEFRERPLLEETGWEDKRSLADAVHEGVFRDRPPTSAPSPAAPLVVAGLASVFDSRAAAASEDQQRLLTKPVGSLGRLEALASFYAGAHGCFPAPPPTKARLALFVADHGVAEEGVSAYGSQVTAVMVANVMAGGAAISCLARRLRVEIDLVDLGVSGDLSALPSAPVIPLRRAAIRKGTANLRVAPAMVVAEASAALHVGRAVARAAVAEGCTLLAVGEIGIGNTTAAAALVCVFADADPEQTVGRGTGISDAVRARKLAVVRDALALHRPRASAPLEALAAVGGLEIAGLVGFLIEAAQQRRPVVLDGFVSCAAALVAAALVPDSAGFFLASHLSPEPGAALALARLGKKPLLELGLRLGEGTGALLALDLVRTAVDLQSAMATFATAGVVFAPIG